MYRLVAFMSPLVLIMSISCCEPMERTEALGDDKLPAAKKKQPKRPPEFFGIVERVERQSILPDSKEFEAVLIKGHPPLDGKLKPSSPLFHNGQPDLLWLNMPHTTVERRNGPIVAGQYVWVWYDGNMIKTEPGQIYPEYVKSEAVMKK